MAIAGGLLGVCEKEFTSKMRSWCGEVDEDLGASPLSQCALCRIRLGRDINAARNIFRKNKDVVLASFV